MATEYQVKLAVTLRPIVGDSAPEIVISVPDHKIQTILHDSTKFELEFVGPSGWLQIQLVNKASTDPHTAVIIDQIEFFGIQDPKFIWHGQYRPEYPEPWFSQQQPPPPPILTNITHLGWNGVWQLDFDVPVFSWIHRVQNLGWVYA